MRHVALFLLMALLAACAVPKQPGASDPLQFDQRHMARANSALFQTSTTRLRVAGIDSVEQLGRFNFQV